MFEASTVSGELQSELDRLRTDGRDRSVGELVDLVGTCQSVINQASAVQTLAMAHVAAIEDVALEDGTVVERHRGLGHQRLDAPALVSDQLGVSDAVASSRVGAAVDLATRAPGVLTAMGDGRLDEYRARIVSDELREAPAEVCAQVVARIADSLGTEPPTALRRRVRHALGAVDADLLRAKAARARTERSLCRWPGDEPGVDTWMGSFPAEQSRSGWAVVDGLARQYVRDGKADRLEQARADALMDLIHARATGTFVVQLAVPADQLTEQTELTEPGHPDCDAVPADAATEPEVEDEVLVTVAGLGMPGTTQVRRGWLTSLTNAGAARDAADTATGAGSAARHEVVACHPETGALMSVADRDGTGRQRAEPPSRRGRAYRPPAALIDLVKARDGQCRFPGCTVNARFCDVDHVRPWPLGSTDASNLMCLCRRHHRTKQTVRWRVGIEPNATVTWTDPTGRVRTTLPLDLLQLENRQHENRQHHLTSSQDPPRPVAPQPVGLVSRAAPDVRWSAWEDELAHQMCAAECATPRIHRGGCHGAGLDVSNRGSVLILDRTYGRTCQRRRPGWAGRRARADEPPPF